MSAQAAERSTRRQATSADTPEAPHTTSHAGHCSNSTPPTWLGYGLRAHGQRQQAGDHLAHQFAGRLALHKGHHLHAEQCGENHQHEAAYRNNNIAGRRGRQCQRKAHGQMPSAQPAAGNEHAGCPAAPQHPCQNPARKPSCRKGAPERP